jgi:hypothetical protein
MDLVERVAILIWERMAGMEYTIHGWESMSAEFQEEWREHARAVVEAVNEPERVYWPSPGWRRPMADPDTEYLERLLEAHEVERPVMGEFDPEAVSPEGQAPDPVLWERARLAQQAEYEAMDSFPVLGDKSD